MKNFRKINFGILLVVLFIITTASTCSNDDSSSSSVNSSNSVISIVNNGTWRITYYYDTDHEETATFSGYDFTFGVNNALTATNGTNTYSGTWSISDSNSNDDSLSDLDFNIAFATPVEFEGLSDDWEIVEKSSSIIKLRDISGGNGGTDYLTFTKN
jgi:hypothetical protein